MNMDPFLTFDSVTLRIIDKYILENTSWQMKHNENWAILGPNGAGKSTLAKSMIDDIPVVKGKIIYHFAERSVYSAASRLISYVSPDIIRDIITRENMEDKFRDFSGQTDQVTTVEEIIMDNIYGNK